MLISVQSKKGCSSFGVSDVVYPSMLTPKDCAVRVKLNYVFLMPICVCLLKEGMRFVFERLMKHGQVSRDDVTGVINAAGK